MAISGIWYNELGSIMDLRVSGNVITGKYQTKVGGAPGIYPLTGYLNAPNPNGIAVGWTVLWNNQLGNKQSLTSWAGQYQLSDGIEEIYTFWLLVRELEHAEDWEATNVGQDTFTRNKPSEKMILKAKKRGKFSHPTQ